MSQNINEMWPFSTPNLYHPDEVKKDELKHLQYSIYKLINNYRDMLLKASRDQGETDDDIHHDIIRKNQDHKSIVKKLASLFSSVYDHEKESSKLKPSFFSDTVFEKIARYAKNKLGHHADEIADYIKHINPISFEDLHKIWTPGSWLAMGESMNFYKMLQIMEAPELGTDKPAPLSNITPELAKIAVDSGHKDNEKGNNADQAVIKNPDSVAVGALSPMQKEVKASKSVGFALGYLYNDGNCPEGGKSCVNLDDMQAIVSSDNYIMDGHHRWAARTLIDPNASVSVARVGIPSGKLITALNIWTKAKGRQGEDAGAKGDISIFASSVPKVLDNFIANGSNEFPNLTAEQVKVALGKMPGANGNAEAGKQIMIQNANSLKTDIHPQAPVRVDMPQVKGEAEMNEVLGKLVKGDIDWNAPFSDETRLAASKTNTLVGANVQKDPGNSGMAVPSTKNPYQAQQINVGANATGAGTTQVSVGASSTPGGPQNQKNNILKFPQQQQNLQRQAASTEYTGASLNEWLVLAGIKES